MLNKYRLTRATFALLFLIVTVLQLFSFPGQFAHIRKVEGFSLLFELALTITVGALFLSAQVIIFSIFKLINFMEKGHFYTHNSFKWIKRIVSTLKIAQLIPLALILLIAPQADDPGVLVMLTAITLFLFSLFQISALMRDQIAIKVASDFG